MNKRALNVCMTVLHVYKKALKLVHGDFARVQKGIEVGSWGGVQVYKRVLKLVQGVLHVYKKVLKLVQGVFARVQKGIE